MGKCDHRAGVGLTKSNESADEGRGKEEDWTKKVKSRERRFEVQTVVNSCREDCHAEATRVGQLRRKCRFAKSVRGSFTRCESRG